LADVRGSANVGLRNSEGGGRCVLAAHAGTVSKAETG
jgi:hypothetical protein